MYEIYNILNNDTIYSIAKDYDTTIDKLSEINGFLPNFKLIPGNNIIVPSNKYNPYKYYTVKKGDNLYSIARQFNTSETIIKNLNNLTSNILSIGQVLKIPLNNKKYVVKSGDTLYSIARNNNTTIDEIKGKNGLTSNTLKIGQELII